MTNQRSKFALGAVVAALAVAGVHGLWFRHHIVDDAFITMRYAANLADGHGAVFNLGEHVEGYTSFSWMLILSACSLLSLDLPSASMWLGGALVLASVLLTCRFPWAGARPSATSIAGLLLASSGAFVAWGKSGLETGLFAFLLLASFAVHLRGKTGVASELLLSGLLALCALTRPEGLLVFGLIFVCRVSRRPHPSRRWTSELLFAIPFLVIVTSHELWRLSYYGYPLPNTFYAKVGMTSNQVGRGLRYLRDFGLAYGALALCAVLSIRTGVKAIGATSVLIGGYVGYIVGVGGDSFPLLRFFAPIMPLICLLAGTSLAAIPSRPLRWTVVPIVCALTSIPSWHGRHWNTIQHDSSDVAVWSELGKWLNQTLGPQESVALNPVGAVGFYCHRNVLDMLGLNDPHIAHATAPMGKGVAGHERADGAYVLGKRPTYVFIGVNHPLDPSLTKPTLKPVYAADRQLLSSPLTETLYAPKVLEVGQQRFACLQLRPKQRAAAALDSIR